MKLYSITCHLRTLCMEDDIADVINDDRFQGYKFEVFP